MKGFGPALLLSLALTCAARLHARPAAPFVSEFLARNTSGITDEDGDRSDWIEIFNPNGLSYPLSGCHLTDNPAEPEKWSFPAVTIPPGGYLLVFASGKNRRTPGSPLHTNFSIASAGEFLALSDHTGALVSEFAPYPPQQNDISWGVISTSPARRYAAFRTPSPGTANNPAEAPADKVSFSPASSSFPSPGSVTVTLSTPSTSAVIRYTTDGSVPSTGANRYTAPITLSASARLRARAFEAGRPDGPLQSESYLAINASAAQFTSNLPIVLTHFWQPGLLPTTDESREGSWMIFAPGPDGLARLSLPPSLAGYGRFERRGSSTLSAAKYSFSMESWDENNADLPIAPLGMPPESDWILHAPFQFDRSLIRNDFIYELSRRCGRYAPRSRLVELFHSTLDGIVSGSLTGPDYAGVYSFMEKIDRDKDRVNVEKISPADNEEPNVRGGYLLKIDRLDPGDSGLSAAGQLLGWVYPRERSPNPALMVTATQRTWMTNYLNAMWSALNARDFWHPQNGYAKFLDPAAAIDHHLLNTAAKNVDALRLSAYLSKSRDGRLAPGPLWDFDRSMGSADGRDLNPLSWRGEGGDLGTDFFHFPWYAEMFRDSNFWQAWIDRYAELRNGPLRSDRILELIGGLASQLNPSPLPEGLHASPVARNQTRWAGSGFNPRPAHPATPGTDGTHAGEIRWLGNWWTSRLAFMDGQFSRPPEASLPSGPVLHGASLSLTSSSLASPGSAIYYTTDGSDPRAFDTTHGTPEPTVTFIPTRHPLRAIVPTASQFASWGTSWRGADLNGNGDHSDDFSDAAWHSNPPGSLCGAGYDDNTAVGTVSFLPFIGLRWSTPLNKVPPNDASNSMLAVNQSCCLRIAFTATSGQLEGLSFLSLRVRSDDGFVAFLNGSEVARSNPPAGYPATPLAWNSAARATTADTTAIQETLHNITAALPLLRPGNNLLAVHGLNYGLGSSDFLFQATLAAGRSEIESPDFSPTARPWSEPLPLVSPITITARTLHGNPASDPPTQAGGGVGSVPNGSSWSAPATFHFFPGASLPSAASLVISEILYRPPSTTTTEANAGIQPDDFEFIRLTNTGKEPLDLTAIQLTGGLSFTSSPGLHNWLPPGASTVVVRNRSAWSARYGSAWPILGEFTGQLDNSGESLTLCTSSGSPIVSLAYSNQSPWPHQPTGSHSIALTNPGNPTSPESWSLSPDPGGSGVSSYSQWTTRHFPVSPESAAQPDADPDHDGTCNLLEYAFASSPHSPSPPPVPSLTLPDRLALSRRITPDLIWSPESSPAASAWTPLPIPPAVSPLSEFKESARWILPASAHPTQLIRVRVSLK
jgi:hypothetical protein